MVADRQNRSREPLDARCYPRLALKAEISARSETNIFTGMSENLSEGGLFISTLSSPSVGERIEIQLALPGDISLDLTGIVRWHRVEPDGEVSGCGVQFTNLDTTTTTLLLDLLRKLHRQPLLWEA